LRVEGKMLLLHCGEQLLRSCCGTKFAVVNWREKLFVAVSVQGKVMLLKVEELLLVLNCGEQLLQSCW
jgi:hypothetical protein